MRTRPDSPDPGRRRGSTGEARLAWALVAPALGAIALVALAPLLWTLWESLHLHDLRMPWRGRPFVGLRHFVAVARDERFLAALGHTLFFTLASVTLEILLGTGLALALHGIRRGRGLLRSAALLPWALPTVVAALVWRFLFDARAGLVNRALMGVGILEEPFAWLAHATAAWVPIVLADVWKTTPFVALLLLAGLQAIDPALYEASRIDGAGPIRQFAHVTLPHLRPALLVALIFRTLDALRVFDLVYVLSGGGPGTATEPLALYAFQSLLQNLRFGFGSALTWILFGVSLILAVLYVRLLGREITGAAR
ncbi:MAG: carbohydrate ABC transporter permease [Acidobacteriota bacterium]